MSLVLLLALLSAVEAVDAVDMTVADMEPSVRFYTQVLGFQKQSEVEVAGPEYEHLEGVFPLRMRVVRLRLGDEAIELTEYLAPRGRPISVDARSNDRSFQHVAIIVSDMDRAYAALRAARARHLSSGPQRLPDSNKAAAGIRAFYFADPDGHPLEVLQFPKDKGDPRWHRPTDRLFLGIDHTAIVVGDTDKSLAFYHDLLGFRIAGESENSGPEQERLNAVFGAHLRITSLRAPRGPGIELLEYLAPGDGRPAPLDEAASDIFHHQTRLFAHDASGLLQQLRAGRARIVSGGLVSTPERKLGFSRALEVLDPDGHRIELAEP